VVTVTYSVSVGPFEGLPFDLSSSGYVQPLCEFLAASTIPSWA